MVHRDFGLQKMVAQTAQLYRDLAAESAAESARAAALA